MGQNKLDNHIKEQLNSREIQPSAQAWDRLDAMLTVAEEKKTKRSFGWLYIAAGILVFVSAGMFFFSQNGTEINTQNSGVVVNDKIEETAGPNPNNAKTNASGTTGSDASIIEKKNEEIVKSGKNQSAGKSIIAQSSFNTSNQNNQNRSAADQNAANQKQSSNINRDQEIRYENSSDVALKDLPKIVEPKKEITLPAKSIPSDEALLASLDKSTRKSNKQPVVKVDAKSLLSQVDGELEMTFREKVINKVSKKYKEIEVALANRNNE